MTNCNTRNTIILLAIFIFTLHLFLAGENIVKVKVIEISEGDLFTAQGIDDSQEFKIRIYGIDSPEQGQNYFEEAKKILSDLIKDKEVNIDILTQDSIGNKVAHVQTDDATNVEELMVKEGYAWWDEENAKEAIELKKLCAEAIRQKKGLWADMSPLSPWDYRRGKGLAQITYKVEKKEEKKTEEKEEKKVLKAKGNEVYKGTFSTSNAPFVDVSKINFNEVKVDPNELLSKHLPTVAKDSSGNAIGLAVPNINQIPYANALGFQDGDIISSVNGIQINDFSQIMPIYEQLKGVKELSVQVIRNGKPITLNFRLP
ncbi:MAG TPA: thermonuclease family protein [Candidatus Hydrogenedens sp.]|nr:thermonuclease family protein [Candidatus Hydrogenedens sp.]HPP58912.1 thermonuclease family protein [Candidatus Hydrogenedens sp.]